MKAELDAAYYWDERRLKLAVEYGAAEREERPGLEHAVRVQSQVGL